MNGNGAFDAGFAGASADGTRVFFATDEPLVAADTDSRHDVYERSGATTTRISAGQINGNGAFERRRSRAPRPTARGSSSRPPSRWSPATPTAATDVYERSGGTTTRVSAGPINGNGAFERRRSRAPRPTARGSSSAPPSRSSPATPTPARTSTSAPAARRRSSRPVRSTATAPSTPTFRGASADGTRVFFSTGEPLVAADTDTRIDVYERSGGTTTRVSTGQVNGNGAFDASFAGASTDGARVFFATVEPLVGADTDTRQDVYERSGGTTTLISAGQINGNGAFDATFTGASADGSRIFFRTNEPLVAADTDAAFDVYERADGTTRLISAGQVNGNGAFDAFFAGASTDGARVFFESDEPLASADTDVATDVYERALGATSLISPGAGPADVSDLIGTSADGSAVFYTTVEILLASDTDDSRDVYGSFDTTP